MNRNLSQTSYGIAQLTASIVKSALCEENQSKETLLGKKLPLQVLYHDGSRSFYVEAGKSPIAIICGKIGVAFDDAPMKMEWLKAKECCKQYFVGRKEWILPELEMLTELYKKKKELNKVLKAFNRTLISEGHYWSSIKYNESNSWYMGFSDGRADWGYKGYSLYIRPVFVL